jgi:acetyl-CoA carboxylase biotin carboxyl carrier protein
MPDSRPPLDPATAVTEVLRMVRGTAIAELEVEWEGGMVRLRREPGAATTPEPASPATEPLGDVTICSNSVGVFHYPLEGPFPRVGDAVHDGDTIAEVETLQLRNAVLATQEGVLAAVLVEDLTPVEYGQPLAVIRAAGALATVEPLDA